MAKTTKVQLTTALFYWVWATDSGQMLSKTVYADGPLVSAVDNLRGQVVESYDGGGKHYVNAYDFKGLPLASFVQLIDDATISDPDWGTITPPALSTEVFTTSVVIDALGRPVTSTDAGGNVTTNTYDRSGALKTVIVNGDTYVQDIHYDAKGQCQTIWYGNGTKTKYTYDPLTYRLTRLCTINLNPSPHVILQDQYYWYDAVGNITQINDAAEEAVFWGNTVIDPVKLYTYDAIYRLIEAQGRERAGSNDYLNDNYEDIGALISSADPHALRNYIQTYTYDAVGNILKLKHEAGAGTYTREFSYVTGKNRLDKTTVDSTDFSFSYDARGNMLDMAHLDTMNWNSQSQLSHVSRGTSMSAYYQYSGGQRVRKVVQKGTIAEERIYLGSFEIYRKKVSGSLQVERTTVHIADDTGRIAMLEVRTEGSAVDDNGTPAELKRFIYSNHLQSSGLELDEDGEIISYEEYHPYGTTAYQAMDSTITATAKRYRFTGKERDEESGLNYHGARYYAPWLCRWCAVDPLESKYAGWSSYHYLKCNPIMDTDSTGMGGDNDKPRSFPTPEGGTIVINEPITDVRTIEKSGTYLMSEEGTNHKKITGKRNFQEGMLIEFSTRNAHFTARFGSEDFQFLGYEDQFGNFYNPNDAKSENKDSNPSGSPAYSPVSAYDSNERIKYENRNEQNAAKAIEEINNAEKVGDVGKARNAAETAFEQRNASRIKTQSKISPGASKYSQKIDPPGKYQFDEMLQKKTLPNEFDTYRSIANSSGKSSGQPRTATFKDFKPLKTFAKITRALALAAVLYEIYNIIDQVSNAPQGEKLSTASKELFSFAVGMILGLVISAIIAPALPIALPLLGFLIQGAAGTAAGYYGSKLAHMIY